MARALPKPPADALPRDPQLAPDRLERHLLAAEAEPELQDAPLALGQVPQRLAHLLAADSVARLLGRILGARVGEEIAELAVAFAADRLVQRGRHLRDVERLDGVLELEAGRLGELLRGRGALQLELETLARPPELDAALVDVGRDADRPRLVRDGALDRPGESTRSRTSRT